MKSLLYENILRRLLFALTPEAAHNLAIWSLARLSFAPRLIQSLLGAEQAQTSRKIRLFGLDFPNEFGLAAGFDKNAVALPAWAALGFGFVEVGTITAVPQRGNPRPRIFRFPEADALINRMGFNNHGADKIADRLRHLKKSGYWPGIPVGINLGKSKSTSLEKAAEDYAYSFKLLYPYADYFVLNVSSPNTPGLRSLQNKAELDRLLKNIQTLNRSNDKPRPILLKIAPDLSWEQIEDIMDLAQANALAGLIATNTTIDHSAIENLTRFHKINGGLSGRPLALRATEIIRFITANCDLPVIGVGGIVDTDSAQEKLDAGARLLQLYTGFVYHGPPLLSELLQNTIPRPAIASEPI